MKQIKSKSDKIYFKDLCLIIKHPGSWNKFERELDKFSKRKELVLLGNLNLQNFSRGRDSFYQAEANEVIGKNFLTSGVKEKLNRFFKKWCGEELFEEAGDNEYRLRIFTAMGPSSKDPSSRTIFFFSKDYSEYIGYFKDLKTQRMKEEKTSGLIKPIIEEELRKCFHTLRDLQVEVVPREDAKFLAELFEKNNFKIVVEGPPMVGKSTFAYLVAKEWLGKVGIVQGKLNDADLNLIRKKDFLVVTDARDLAFNRDLYASLQRFAEKLLIVRRKSEPSDRDLREALDEFPLRKDFFTYLPRALGEPYPEPDVVPFKKDFFAGGEIEPIKEIRCELGRMENIIGVVNAIEKTSRIKVDGKVKEEICSICVSSDKKHTILGLVKAIFIGLTSLRNKGEIGDLVTINDFERIEASKLMEYEASEKLKHIYTWLDEDVQILLKAFRFLNKVVIEPILPKLVVEEAYMSYNGEKLLDTTIEKAENLGIIHAIDGGYRVWHPWQIEVIELKQEIRPALDELIIRLRSALPYDKDKRITLTLAKLLWDAPEMLEFANLDWKNDALLKESIKYFKEYYSHDKHRKYLSPKDLIPRVYTKINCGKPLDAIQNLESMLYIIENDEIGKDIAQGIKRFIFYDALSDPELIGENDLIIKAWLDFAYELTIKEIVPDSVRPATQHYILNCLDGILDNPNLTLEAKEFWIEHINKIALKTVTEELTDLMYIHFITCILWEHPLTNKEKEYLLKTIITLAKKHQKNFVEWLKEEYMYYFQNKSPEKIELLENCLKTF